MFFELDFSHNDLYCCVEYSELEYHVEIFKSYEQKRCSKAPVEHGIGRKLHDLKYFEVGIFFPYSLDSLYT